LNQHITSEMWTGNRGGCGWLEAAAARASCPVPSELSATRLSGTEYVTGPDEWRPSASKQTFNSHCMRASICFFRPVSCLSPPHLDLYIDVYVCVCVCVCVSFIDCTYSTIAFVGLQLKNAIVKNVLMKPIKGLVMHGEYDSQMYIQVHSDQKRFRANNLLSL